MEKPKVVLTDSFFKSLDEMNLSAEEQQELLDQLNEFINSPDLFENSTPISDEEYQMLVEEGIISDDEINTSMKRVVN